MRTQEDALRSIRRYVASALGSPPWRVRFAMDDRFRRPAALVNTPTPSPVSAGGVDTVRVSLAVYVQLFPEVGVNGSESKLLAERAASVLMNALTLGVPDAVVPSVVGHRQRIPLWDYTDDSGDPLPAEGTGSVATKRTARDYLEVADGFTFQTLPMAQDDQLFTSVLDMRVQWFRNARLISPGSTTLESVIIDF